MRKPKIHILCAMTSLWLLLGSAIAVLLSTLLYGARTIDLGSLAFGLQSLSLTLRLDTLSTLMLVMVQLLGVVIGHFSIRYLDGEAGQRKFFYHLLGIVTAVSLLVTANNLVIFFMAWVLTSFALHRLLLFYPRRTKARQAAYTKQMISRMGDTAIFFAIILAYKAFGTTEMPELFAKVAAGSAPNQAELIALLLALGAMTKSAQIPFHFWLPDTMETPTPVSALMHAGIINAGGFLIVRFSALFESATYAPRLLLIVGAFTAVYASLIMITQNSIKKKLAYSTISQMGLMMFACGLGAYTIALMHIIAHSIYKAHAFLTTGAIVEESKKIGFKPIIPSNTEFTAIILVGICSLLGAYIFRSSHELSLVAYGSVLWLGLCQGFLSRPDGFRPTMFLHVSMAGIIGGGLIAYSLAKSALSSLLPLPYASMSSGRSPDAVEFGFVLAGYALFSLGFFLHGQLLEPRTVWLKRLYLHLWKGGYRLRWPSQIRSSLRPERSASC